MKSFFEVEQRTDAWWALRRSRPTASEFHRIMTPKTMKPSSSQDEYLDELLAEFIDQRFSQEPENAYVSPSMQNGIDCESTARAWYSFDHDCDVREVGFCLSDCGRYGCSPDGLIFDGDRLVKGLEIKCPDLKTHLRYLREGCLPSEYRCQVHGEMAVCGADEWDFISYSPIATVENFVFTVRPDEFTVALKKEVERFCDRVESAKQRILKPEMVTA